MALIEDLLNAAEKFAHRAHQLAGVIELVKDFDLDRTSPFGNLVFRRELPNCFALFDEVGAGKSKQIVDAAQILYRQGKVDTMVVLVPGYARSTWAEPDPMLGEVAKHAWDMIPNVIHEFHARYDEIEWAPNALNWIVTNYEFIRRDERLLSLIKQLRGRKTWLVCDESWMVKGRTADQTKAVAMIRRKRADRVTLLNGTPLADGKPVDLYAQMQILDPGILGVKNFSHFKAKYCIMGGFKSKQIVDYQNLDELTARIAPYVLTRRTRDCFDLPPMLDPVLVEARLSQETWKIYVDQRDEMVSWFAGQASVSKQAIVRGLRLAQITSGYLGGLEDVDSDVDLQPAGPDWSEPTRQPVPQWLRSIHELPPDPAAAAPAIKQPDPVKFTKELGREKLDAMMNWLGTMPTMPNKLLIWCRFKPEGDRTAAEIKRLYSLVERLKGGQTDDEKAAAKRLLSPDSDPALKGCVVGNQKAGGASLNFSGANVAVYLSQGPALIERTQSIGRIERPGQRNPMLVVDVVATGPKGQKTIDHHILRALRNKDDMARWTVDQWRRILAEE